MRNDPVGLEQRAAPCAAAARFLALLAVLASLAVPLFAPPIHAQAERGAEDDATALPGEDELGDDDLFADDDALRSDESLFEESAASDAAPSEAEVADDLVDPADSVDEPSAAQVATGEKPATSDRGDEPTLGIEEILIQGQTGTGIDVEAPVSVTSFEAAELAALGAQDVADLAAYTPNLEIKTTGASRPTFFIRGVGLNDFTANASGAIAIYQDNVALGLPAIQLGQLFDVENVNVLRGPQGFGPARNASGGAIHISSKQPSGEFAGFLRSDFGRFNFKDFEGALELPLLGDVLSARFAFRAEERDPFVRNGCGGAPPIGPERITAFNDAGQALAFQPAFCGETGRATITNPNPPPVNVNISSLPAGLERELNNSSRWATRGQLRLQPPDTDLDILFNVHGGRVDQLARAGEVIGTSGSIIDPVSGDRIRGFFGGTVRGYRAPEVTRQLERIQQRLGVDNPALTSDERVALLEKSKVIIGRKLADNLDKKPFRGDFNNPGAERLSTVGGFLRIDGQLGEVHWSSTTGIESYDRYLDTDADLSPVTQFETKTKDKAWQLTEDLRVSGELERYPVSWNSGFYVLVDSLDFDRASNASSSTVAVRAFYRQETASGGAYLDGSWEFTDDFKLEGGVRYQLERKSFDQRLIRGTTAPQVQPGTRVCEFQDCTANKTFHAPTGSLSLVYRATEEISFYWKYSRGWKAAQYSSGGASGPVFTFAKPETIDSFEVGGSGAWFDGRVTFSASAFHYAYQDYHVFVTRNDAGSLPTRIVVNADDAQVYGAEFEASVEPFEGLVLRGRGGWLESEFVDFTQQQVRIQFQPPPAPSELTQVSLDFTGNRLPNTPRFSFSGSAEYTLELGRYGSLVPRWDFSWTDDIFFDQSNGRGASNDVGILFMPDLAIGQRSYWLHNLRLTYKDPSGHFEVSGWIRNLENTIYKQLAYDGSAVGLVGNLVGDPRTYGVSFTFTW